MLAVSPSPAATVAVTTYDPGDLDGTVRLARHAHGSTDARIQQTILCAGMIAYRTSTPNMSQQFTVHARTTDNKQVFPHRQFASAVHAAALQLWHNQGLAPSRLCQVGFWAPRLRLLYARALAHFLEHAEAHLDDLWVEARVGVVPFVLEVRVGALAGSAARTCRVLVCRGRRPASLVDGWQLSDDPCGLARLCVPPVSDVLLVDPGTQRMGEGLLSWLFVLRRLPSPSPSLSSTKEEDKLAYCVEAPVGAQDVGDRVVRAVLGVCGRQGMEVKFVGARLEDAMDGRWAAAFIAAEAVGLLPIDTMYLTGRRRTAVDIPACPLATHLQCAVRDALHSGDTL
ncbi:hypothetical protein LPJ53_002729 [Coemansia erecta]|uniref:Uncharacterized protein n=1 Tax=Coemansia erecta TaxID=147472 RepID=A0A9W7Y2Q8_9FUNG|nr:hypothetical protein LPJ53_002729 [Coemansia erecta]